LPTLEAEEEILMPKRTFDTEKDVKAEVKKLLTDHGWFWWMPPGNGFGTTGVADFNALKAGVFLAVEAKFGSNKPTKRQKAYLQSISAESGFGFAVNEKTVGDLARWLVMFDRSVEAVQKGGKMSDEDGAGMLDAIRALTAMVVGASMKPDRT
jgi:hypothetical protein